MKRAFPSGKRLMAVALVAVALGVGLFATRALGWGFQHDAFQEGTQLYGANCVRCHGEAGNRVPVVPLNSADYLDQLGDAQLIQAIAQGKNSMPAFAKESGGTLSADQIEIIARYLRSPQSPARKASPSAAPTGHDLYVDNCSSCHGLDGAKVPQARIGSEEYVNSRGEAALNRIIVTGQGTMPGFADSLQADQVKLIVGYLRTLGPRAAATSAPGGTSIQIPHSIDGRTDSCLVCHGQNGMVPFPADHAGRSNSSCLGCHKVTSTASPAAIPRVAHDLQGRDQCLTCHGPKGLRPAPSDHDGRTNDSCLECHQKANPTPAGGIPRMPHDLQGREDCLSCHKTGFSQPIPADHAGRPADKCKDCHKPAATGGAVVAPQIPHDTTGADNCLRCHGTKQAPSAPAQAAPTPPAQVPAQAPAGPTPAATR